MRRTQVTGVGGAITELPPPVETETFETRFIVPQPIPASWGNVSSWSEVSRSQTFKGALSVAIYGWLGVDAVVYSIETTISRRRRRRRLTEGVAHDVLVFFMYRREDMLSVATRMKCSIGSGEDVGRGTAAL